MHYAKIAVILAFFSAGFAAVAEEQSSQGPAFTKIANSGEALPQEAALGAGKKDWACLQDNRTGLIWEIKTADGRLRDQRWTYTPFDSNPVTNGGFPGYKDKTSGACLRSAMAESSCNTEAYVYAVRASSLCGYSDWRLPTVSELVALSAQTADAAPEATNRLLPNTQAGWYWTGIERIGITQYSRVILLPPGGQPTFYDGSYLVILVRGGGASKSTNENRDT